MVQLTIPETQMTNSHGTNDHFYGTIDHFCGRNDHFYGTNDYFYGTKGIVTAQTMGGCRTWSRETVRSGYLASGGGELILLRNFELTITIFLNPAFLYLGKTQPLRRLKGL